MRRRRRSRRSAGAPQRDGLGRRLGLVRFALRSLTSPPLQTRDARPGHIEAMLQCTADSPASHRYPPTCVAPANARLQIHVLPITAHSFRLASTRSIDRTPGLSYTPLGFHTKISQWSGGLHCAFHWCTRRTKMHRRWIQRPLSPVCGGRCDCATDCVTRTQPPSASARAVSRASDGGVMPSAVALAHRSSCQPHRRKFLAAGPLRFGGRPLSAAVAGDASTERRGEVWERHSHSPSHPDGQSPQLRNRTPSRPLSPAEAAACESVAIQLSLLSLTGWVSPTMIGRGRGQQRGHGRAGNAAKAERATGESQRARESP